MSTLIIQEDTSMMITWLKNKIQGRTVLIKRVHPTVKLPTRGTSGSAGWDFYAPEDVTIAPGEIKRIPLGISLAFSSEYVLFAKEKSSIGINTPLLAKGGVIDSDYRGEIHAIFQNEGKDPTHFHKGEKIIQGVFVKLGTFNLKEVDSLPDSERGHGGFGSTGRF